MSFVCPVSDQRLVLNHVVRIAELSKSNRFAEATSDTVDAVLEAAAEFAQGELAPLNDVGDRHASRWKEGAVTTPPGFREAYAKFVEGGWMGLVRVRRGGRAGASEQPVGRDDGGLQRRERRLRALSDARARSGRGHRSPRLRGAEARLPAEDRQRRMDRDDEPDRAAGRQRRRSAEIARGSGRRRKLAHHPAPRSSSPMASTT